MEPFDAEFDVPWPDRDRAWRRKLRRLDLSSPIGPQLLRHRRVAIALMAISSAIGLMFLAIFGAFGRPEVGGVLAGVLIGPVVGLAWLDHRSLRSGAEAYVRDRAESKKTPGPTG